MQQKVILASSTIYICTELAKNNIMGSTSGSINKMSINIKLSDREIIGECEEGCDLMEEVGI